jgi:hypothetical protein
LGKTITPRKVVFLNPKSRMRQMAIFRLSQLTVSSLFPYKLC